MKNKKFVIIEFCKAGIPSGMHRSVVETNAPCYSLHAVGMQPISTDASLTGCKRQGARTFLPSEAFLTECNK